MSNPAGANLTLVDPSAEELAAQAAAGSSASFDELVDRFGPRLLRYLRQKVRDTHTAEDLVQETLLKAYRNLERFDPSRRFSTWLFTIATRQAASWGRSRRMPVVAQAYDRADAGADNPLEAVSLREQHDDLWARASRELPEYQFSALWLRYAEDMSVQEIAGVMKKSTGNVKVLLHRARRTLLECRPVSTPSARMAASTQSHYVARTS